MAAQRRNSDSRSDVVMSVKVTRAEREAIRSAASRAGMTTSDYVRGTALSSSRSTRSTRGATTPP